MRRRRGKRSKEDDPFEANNVCRLCKQEANEEHFGKFFVEKQSGFSVHQYCMFFSSGLAQRGEDDEGFDGFLIKDIKKEITRAKRLRCNFCKKPGASIGCCVEKCHQTYHYNCGRQRGSLFQFFDSFNSFCTYHRPTQQIHLRESDGKNCPICLNDIEWNSCPFLADVPLLTPCCKVWFHNKCLQRHAHSSGLYYFKCPLCNNKKEFQDEMKRMGVYIPEQDASWEKGDAFADLLFRYNRCDAQNCICPHGKEHKATSGKWRIRLCDLCGQFGTHVKCQHWKRAPAEWYCDVCGNTLPYSSTRKRPVVGDHSMDPCFGNVDDSSSDEDCEVNVCSVSDEEMPLATVKRQPEGHSSTEGQPCFERASGARDQHKEALQQRSMEKCERDPSSETREHETSSDSSQVEDKGSPLRKRQQISTKGGNSCYPDEKDLIRSNSENTVCSLNKLVLDSTEMTPSVLLAISESVREGLLDGHTVVGDKTSILTVSAKVEHITESPKRNSDKNEVIVIEDTDSESSSEYSVELIEEHQKPRSSHRKRRRKRRKLDNSVDLVSQVEADSSAPLVSVEVKKEMLSEQGFLDLSSKREATINLIHTCLHPKGTRSCPLGNDKFGECFLRCCNPGGYSVPDVLVTNSVRANRKCGALQSTTVSSTSSSGHRDTCLMQDQTRDEPGAGKELRSIGTNTLPMKLISRKRIKSKQTAITDTYFPMGKNPVSTFSQTVS
ncbi:uncharacterized protein LOC114961283 [Acropora millepora]|uniref:uncharacterized protein LOC114961283 n=1 Tax=Acropora millepora TaxID=45264 RepID=UPI001CF5EE13|nr:uncharacterized protein LOC114961283 [Acropora millepora]